MGPTYVLAPVISEGGGFFQWIKGSKNHGGNGLMKLKWDLYGIMEGKCLIGLDQRWAPFFLYKNISHDDIGTR